MGWRADGRTDGCMHAWMDEWTYIVVWMDGWLGGWVDGGMHGCMNGPIYMVSGWVDIEGWMHIVDLRGGWMDNDSHEEFIKVSIAQLVERLLLEREVVVSNPVAAPYQRCKNGTSSSLADAPIQKGCARKIE